DLDSVGKMLWVAFIKLRPNGQPEIRKDNHPTENVQSVEPRNGEIAGEICTVLGQKHVGVLDVFLLDFRDLVRWRDVKKMGAIHRWICRISIHRIERDLIFLYVLVTERLPVMQMTGDLEPWRKSLLGEMMIPEVRLVLLERIFFDKGAEVITFLGLLVD